MTQTFTATGLVPVQPGTYCVVRVLSKSWDYNNPDKEEFFFCFIDSETTATTVWVTTVGWAAHLLCWACNTYRYMVCRS